MSRRNLEIGNKEKALVALASAMGAGCRHCADRLHPMAREAGASSEEIQDALQEGLRARENATAIMRRKAELLLGHRLSMEAPGTGEENAPMTRLTGLAAAVAANAAPDAVRHLEAADFAGVTSSGIEVVLAIARKVRGKAQMYSDEEFAEHRGERSEPGAAGEKRATAGAGQARGVESCCEEVTPGAAGLCGCG